MRRAEVGHADGAYATFREQALCGAVRVNGAVEVLWERLVEEVEVHRVEPELSGTDVEAMKGFVVPVVADPQLGLDEQLRPLDGAGCDRGANLALIEV